MDDTTIDVPLEPIDSVTDPEWEPPRGHRDAPIVPSEYHLRPRDRLVPSHRLLD